MNEIKKGKKYCSCLNGKHRRIHHCIISSVLKSNYFYLDYPFGRPASYDTGLWCNNDIHIIKNWGKKRLIK